MPSNTRNLLIDGDFQAVDLTTGASGVSSDPTRGNFTQTAPTGWGSATGGVGDFAPTSFASPGFAGTQVAYLNAGASLSQSFATGGANGSGPFLISFDLGTRLDAPLPNGATTVTATVGSTVIGQLTFDAANATRGGDTHLNFITQNLNTLGLAGQNVTLTFANGSTNSQLLVDNVVAQPVNLLTDGDFQSDNLSSGAGVTIEPTKGNYTSTAPSGWTVTGGSGGGDFAPTSAASTAFAGSHVAYLTANAQLSQTFTPPVVAGGSDPLTISLDIGTRLDVPPTSGTVTITATVGSTVIGQTTFDAVHSIAGGETHLTFATQDLNAPGLAGQNVTLAIANGSNNQILVDNVVVQSPVTFDVSDEAGLNAAIQAIDVSGQAVRDTAYRINITGPINLTTALDALNLPTGASLTIAGMASDGSAPQMQAIDGGGSQRGFFVYSGNVTFENLTIQHMLAKGGNGVEGGGGGAGLGGGLFVANDIWNGAAPGNVTLVNVNFANDAARGGDGGADGSGFFGGGGGLGQDGAPHSPAVGGGFNTGGGGGGGVGSGSGAGIVLGAADGGDGHDFATGNIGLAGAPSGGMGGGGLEDGGGGGGGVGGGDASVRNVNFQHFLADGANGGFGGGGGGSGNVSNNVFSNGGTGGFGGGGGSSFSNGGGAGGFGGGGGLAHVDTPGGFGAGNSIHDARFGGGGGLGAGGDVFVMEGASVTISSGTLSDGTVTGGHGGGFGSGDPYAMGHGYGSGIFIQGNQSITFGTGQTAGQTTTITGVITDQLGADPSNLYGQPASGTVVIAGAGTVVLAGDNRYTGGTIVQGGTLSITQDTSLGLGSNGLTLENGTAVNITGFDTFNHQITLEGDPTIEVDSGTTTDVEQISGIGAELIKTGAGTLVLNPSEGSNTYTGGTTIAGGVLELANAQSAGTGAITFASGVHTTLQVDGTAIPTNTIDGFTFGDTIDLAGIAYDGSAQPNLATGNHLQFTENGHSYQINFDPAQSFTGGTFTLSPDSSNTGTEVRLVPTFTATDEASLNTAIQAIDVGGSDAGSDTAYRINITAPINLTTALDAINLPTGVSLTIAGIPPSSGLNGGGGNGGAGGNQTTTQQQGETIDGGGSQRGFFVYSGNVTFENLTIKNTLAKGGNGGNGGDGGGGGAGLGGGLFVADDTANGAAPSNVTLINVNFMGNKAQGGNGGIGNGDLTEFFGDGGGGGLGQDGLAGAPSDAAGGGGGIGSGSGAGIVLGAAAGGGSPGAGSGSPDGGVGANSLTSPHASLGGGGGGVGGTPGQDFGVQYNNGILLDNLGGDGGFGGGGGGGSNEGRIGSDHVVGTSGSGGFGGGGGGGFITAGASQFGGGGGGGFNPGSAGFGAGDGSFRPFAPGTPSAGDGGGGLGAGGAVFVMHGASLSITGGTLANGTVVSGQGAESGMTGGASDGQAYGAGIFIQGNQSITFGAGQTSLQITTINGDITDQSGSDPGNVYGQPGAGKVFIAGAGLVVLGGNNSYTGGTEIQGGTLKIAANGNIGSGSLTMDDGTAVNLTGIATFNHAIALNGDPTIEVDSGTTTETGVISGVGADLVKTGAGTLVLNPAGGSNTYTGGTTIAGGVLELATANAAGTGAITFGSGVHTTLQIDGSVIPTNTIDGFAFGDTIDLAGIAYDGSAQPPTLLGNHQLQFTEHGQSYLISFDPNQQTLSTGTFWLSPDSSNNGTLVQLLAPGSVGVTIDSSTLNLANNTATVTFTFGSAPTAFILADLNAVGGALSNLHAVNGFAGLVYAATFTAAASTDINNASVSVIAGSYHDAAGHSGLAGSTPDFTVDTVAPTVGVTIDNPSLNLAHNTATVTFAFSEAPTGFTLADTTATGGALSNLVQVDATDYTATFTAAAATNITNADVSVTAGSWQEDNGNPGLGGSTPDFSVDTLITNEIWSKAVSGNFDTVSHWNPADVPDQNSNVLIKKDGTYTVNDSTDHTVNKLTVGNTTPGAVTLDILHATLQVNGGAIINTGVIELNSPAQLLIGASTKISGGGSILLGDTDHIGSADGLGAAVRLTNVDNTVHGSGSIGDTMMTLLNEGSITAEGGTLEVFSATVNRGTLTAASGGTLILDSTLNDTIGTLTADDGGHLTVDGAVSAGEADIIGSGTIEFGAASKAHVGFSGAAPGDLILDDASHFKGDIAGFADTDKIDLEDFLVGSTTVKYGGYSDTTHTTTLTFKDTTDPTHKAVLTFDGDYARGELQVGGLSGGHIVLTHNV